MAARPQDHLTGMRSWRRAWHRGEVAEQYDEAWSRWPGPGELGPERSLQSCERVWTASLDRRLRFERAPGLDITPLPSPRGRSTRDGRGIR